MSLSRPHTDSEISFALEIYREKKYRQALDQFHQLSYNQKKVCMGWMAKCYLRLAAYDPNKYEEAIRFLEGYLEENPTEKTKYYMYSNLAEVYFGLAQVKKQYKDNYLKLAKENLENIPYKFQKEKEPQVLRLWASYYMGKENFSEVLDISNQLLMMSNPTNFKSRHQLLELQVICYYELKNKTAMKESALKLAKNIEFINDIEQKLITFNLLTHINKNLDIDDKIPLMEINGDFGKSSDRIIFKAATYYENRGFEKNNEKDIDKADKYFLQLISRKETNYWTWQAHISYACFLQKKVDSHEASIEYSNKVIDAFLSDMTGIKPTNDQYVEACTSLNIANGELSRRKESKEWLKRGLKISPDHVGLKSTEAKSIARIPQEKHEKYEEIRKTEPKRLDEKHGKDGLQVPSNVSLEHTASRFEANQNKEDFFSSSSKEFLVSEKAFPQLNNKVNNNISDWQKTRKVGFIPTPEKSKSFKEALVNEKPNKKNWLILPTISKLAHNSNSSFNKKIASQISDEKVDENKKQDEINISSSRKFSY